MPEIKLNLRPNLLRLFRYLSAIILNYLNQFRKRSIVYFQKKSAVIFNCLIEQDLIQKLPNNSIVMMDNASFHKSHHLKTMIEKDGHILEYVLTYSPDLNHIEKKCFQAKSSRIKYHCDLDNASLGQEKAGKA